MRSSSSKATTTPPAKTSNRHSPISPRCSPHISPTARLSRTCCHRPTPAPERAQASRTRVGKKLTLTNTARRGQLRIFTLFCRGWFPLDVASPMAEASPDSAFPRPVAAFVLMCSPRSFERREMSTPKSLVRRPISSPRSWKLPSWPNELHHGHEQQRGVKGVGAVVLSEALLLRVPALLHDLPVDGISLTDPEFFLGG